MVNLAMVPVACHGSPRWADCSGLCADCVSRVRSLSSEGKSCRALGEVASVEHTRVVVNAATPGIVSSTHLLI